MKQLVKINCRSIHSTYGYIIDTYTNKSGTMALIKVGCRADWSPWLGYEHCIILGENHYTAVERSAQ